MVLSLKPIHTYDIIALATLRRIKIIAYLDQLGLLVAVAQRVRRDLEDDEVLAIGCQDALKRKIIDNYVKCR